MQISDGNTPLPPGFGDGWLSANAADLIRIAVTFGGFPKQETVRRVALAGDPTRKTNAATVCRVLQELYDEQED